MPSQVSSTQVHYSQPQVPVVKVNESSGCLDALISKIWSCVQAVLNFLTCGCFSSSSKQESAGSPVDPSRVQQLSQEGKSGGGSQISSRTRLQEPELDQPESSFDDFSDGSSVASSEEDELLVKEVSDTNAATFKDGEKQTRLKETLKSWQEAMYTYSISMENDFKKQVKTANLLVDAANRLIEQGADVKKCDPNGLMLNTVMNSIIGRVKMFPEAQSELEMVSIFLTGGVQLQKRELEVLLSNVIEQARLNEGSLELLKLFIEKRKEAIVQCNRDQMLLVTAAMQVINNTQGFADTELKIFKMLLDAELQIREQDLKSILWQALQECSKDHCRNLIIEFITKRREAVLECDTDSNLFRLANDQAKKTINDQAKADLEFIALNLNPGRSRQGW